MFLYNQSETNINDLIDFLFKPNDVLACSIIKCINSDNTTITSHSRTSYIIHYPFTFAGTTVAYSSLSTIKQMYIM